MYMIMRNGYPVAMGYDDADAATARANILFTHKGGYIVVVDEFTGEVIYERE